MSLYPRLYNPGPIEPIVEIGQNLGLFRPPNGLDVYQVEFIDTFPVSAPIIVNLATSGLAAATNSTGTTTGQTPVSLANQEDENNGQVAQFRFFVLDPVSVGFFQGSGAAHNTNLPTRALFTMNTRYKDPHDAMSEHFVYEQLRGYMQATNYLGHAVNQARVALYGFKYILAGSDTDFSGHGGQKLTPIKQFNSLQAALASSLKFTVVPVQGWV